MLMVLLMGLVMAWPAGFADDFQTDSRKAYAIQGDIRWESGRLILGPNCSLTRTVAFGDWAEVRAKVRLRSEPEQRALSFLLRLDEGIHAGIALDASDNKIGLLNLNRLIDKIPHHRVELTASPAGPAAVETVWELLFQLRYGVARAKAWRQGEPEPAAWQTQRYKGSDHWSPSALVIGVGAYQGGELLRLQLLGCRPPALWPAETKRKLDRDDALHQDIRELWRQGRFDAAVAKAQELLRIRLEIYGPDHPRTASAYNNLSVLFKDSGRHTEARVAAERALAISERTLGPDHPSTGVDWNSLAGAYEDGGDLIAAQQGYERARDIFLATRGFYDEFTANALNNLGVIRYSQNNFGEARANFEQVLKIRQVLFADQNPTVAQSMTSLGMTLFRQDELNAAQPLLEKALALRQQILGVDHPDTLHGHVCLAELLRRQGRRQAARLHLEEAWELSAKKLGPGHPKTLIAELNLGDLLLSLEDKEAASRHLHNACTEFDRLYGGAHPQTADAAFTAARLAAVTASPAEALREYLEATRRWADVSAAWLAGGAEREHRAATLTWEMALHSALTLAEDPAVRAHEVPDDLASAILDWKAISSKSLLARQEAVVTQGDLEAVRLYDRLKAIRAQLVRQVLQGGDGGESYRRAVRELNQEHDEVERQLSRRVAAFSKIREQRRANARALAQSLPAGAVLIEMIRFLPRNFAADVHPWQPARYLALVIWRPADGTPVPAVRLVSLGGAEPIDNAIHAWRAEAKGGHVDGDADRLLRECLFEPLAKVLPAETERLVISPDGEVSLVPWEAIRVADGRYLVEQFQVGYVGNGRDLMLAPKPIGKLGEAVVFANPDYDTADSPQRPEIAANHRSGDWAKRDGDIFARLPGFEHEADAVAKAWQAAKIEMTLRRITGPAASEETLATVRRPRLLYFITHGYFLQDLQQLGAGPNLLLRDFEFLDLGTSRTRPLPLGEEPELRSGLALAGANQWRKRSEKGLSDGLLSAKEVRDLDLWGTELVVLSACETGLGEVQVGEGVLGLRRAFQLAGAQTVLASLWKVPDTETEQLMSRFFELWLSDKHGKAAALRQAQLEMIARLRKDTDAKRQAAPPLYWAGFICHGKAD